MLDICRDPRFGRQGEGYGEDPTLAAAMGAAYVAGLQQDGQMLATAKHFLGFMAGQGGIHAAPHLDSRRANCGRSTPSPSRRRSPGRTSAG